MGAKIAIFRPAHPKIKSPLHCTFFGTKRAHKKLKSRKNRKFYSLRKGPNHKSPLLTMYTHWNLFVHLCKSHFLKSLKIRYTNLPIFAIFDLPCASPFAPKLFYPLPSHTSFLKLPHYYELFPKR